MSESRLASELPSNQADGMTTRVVRGSLWTLSGQGVTILASLIATPFVIRLLGTELFGVLSLINVLIGYISFADLGMTTASTRFAGQAFARNDERGEAAVVDTSLIVALIPAVFIAGLMALCAMPILESALRLPEDLQSGALIALRIAAGGFIFRVVAGVLNTPQLVRFRMALNTLINSGITAVQILLVPVMLLIGGGLVGAVAIIASAAILIALTHAIVAKRLLAGLLKFEISAELIKPLARFGLALTLSSLGAAILMNAEKLFLTRFDSTRALAHYSVAYNLAVMLSVIPIAMSQSLLPAFSRLHGGRDHASSERLYSRALRANLLWAAPAGLMLCAIAKPFFTFWAGPEYGQASTVPFYILIFGLIFNILAYVPNTLLLAYGRSDLIARIHLGELLPHLLCVALLTYKFGAIGAALAWSLRVIVDMVLFFIVERQISGFAISMFEKDRLSYLISLMVLMLPGVLIAKGNLPTVVVLAAAFFATLTYFGIVWTRILSSEEQLWAQGIVRSLFGKLASSFA